MHTRFLVLFLIFFTMGCSTKSDEAARKTIQSFEKEFAVNEAAFNLADFNANVTGEDSYYKQKAESEMKQNQLLTNKELFKQIINIKDQNPPDDKLLQRQITLIYNMMAEKQLDESKLNELVMTQNKLEQKFTTYRALLDGKAVSDNVIDSILKNSTDSEMLKKAWLASKVVGDSVASDIIQLVHLRNTIAQELGFKNYYLMRMTLSEQNPEDIENLFDELDNLTRFDYTLLKSEIDTYLANRLGISANELMPWHYQNKFFQEAPQIYTVDLDKYYENVDIPGLITKYYEGIGLEVKDILARSDLYEKPGKNQHAFCTHIDRKGDVRILANIRSDSYWANTMLHELGHAVYDKNIDSTLPYLLRQPAHTFTTEAIANMFGRLASNPEWLKVNLQISEEEYEQVKTDVNNSLRLEQLVFSRWSQVVFRFEKAMYENPDQDLNALWWQLVEKYQQVTKPENRNNADWASKIHLAIYPCYYYNYLLGEILASQIMDHIRTSVVMDADAGMSDDISIGEYLINYIFEPGATNNWDLMVEEATGRKLSSKFYAADFISTQMKSEEEE